MCVYFVAGMNPVPMNIAIDVVPVFVCKWAGIEPGLMNISTGCLYLCLTVNGGGG